jgi:septum formation protein
MKYIKTMLNKIVLASKSDVRKKILEDNKITCRVEPSNVDEENIKESLLKEKATPTIISKNLAELKANKISQKLSNEIVLGADSVIDLEGEIISKPNDRMEALKILQKLNGKTHQLVSSVCISRGGSMIWNYTDKASLTMKNLSLLELEVYLKKIPDAVLYAYNVYQIEGEGKNLFSKIEGNKDTIMGLPIKQIREYLNTLE